MPVINCAFTDAIRWEVMPPAALDDGCVHVWRLQLSVYEHMASKVSRLLNTHELIRAGKYHQEKDRIRFILSRAALRLILGRYMHVPAQEIAFGMQEDKKPFVTAPETDLQYNASHSGDWVLIAVARQPVGVDTEDTTSGMHIADVIATCFSKEEADHILGAADTHQCFYELWTRKEVLVKATGRGIDDNMISVPCMNGIHEVTVSQTGSNKDWNVLSFAVDANNKGSVAYDPAVKHISFYEASVVLTAIK